MARIFLLFLTIPVLEILIYIQLSKITGLGFTIAVIFITGAVGAFLARREGLLVINSIKGDLSLGQVPGNHLIEGLLVLVGAVLLLTPGLLTDIVGFILLIPQTRYYIREFAKKKMRQWIDSGQVYFYVRR